MSRRLVYLLLGLAVVGFLVWKADADAVPPARPSTTLPTPVAEENAEEKQGEPQPEEVKEVDEQSADEKQEESKKSPSTEEKKSDDKSAEKDSAEGTADEKGDASDADQKTEPSADAEKKTEGEGEEKEQKSKPYKVERKPLRIDVKLDGVFVADQMEEVALRPEVWTQFKVLEAVEHGTVVKKGDVLVRFDDEKIEDELAEQSIDQRIGELSLMQEEEEFPRDEKLLELKYDQAKTTHDQLVEDFEYYKKVDRPFMVRIAEYRYNSAKEDLDSQREELEQLEKMYEADEVTEDTEAIVLRRQRFEVATAELVLELQKSSRDYTLNVVLPRNDESYAKQLEESDLKFAQVKTARDMGLTRGKYELEKKREARATSVERNAKLLSDRALMELRAPTDGTVYYGRCVNGKWAEISSLTPKLQPFGTVAANTVLMTIVKQRPLHVETKLAEKDLPDFKQGLAAEVVPTADDDLELSGKVTEILPIPDGGNKFQMQMDVNLAEAPEWLVAGMNCEATVTVYENKSALVIPTDLVQTDKEDEKTKYVMVLDPKEEKPIRRNVKLGRSKDKLVEVLRGLKEGDEIVKEEKEEKDKS
jgi:multidrug efflux pump subunit AcrA (membrane-fusion protein)